MCARPEVAWLWVWIGRSVVARIARTQFEGGVGGEQPGHVLDGDGVATHLRHAAGELDEVRDVMHRAGGIADRAFGMLAGGLTASTETRRLRRSFIASKMRNTSTPLSADFCTNARTTSSE
jgi:hypothetical protein